MDRAYFRRMAAAASTLEERVTAGCRPRDTPDDRMRAAALMARWSRSVYGGDDAKLACRLAWSVLTPETAAPYLGRVRWPKAARLPGWARTLRRTLAIAARAVPLDQPPAFLQPAAPVPFEQALAPLVVAAQRQLARRAGKSLRRLGPQARDDLARGLLQSLASVCTRQLSFELTVFRAVYETELSRWLRRSQNRRSAAIYELFCAQLWDGALVALLAEYPCLGRWVGTLLRDWVRNTAELAQRLDQDRSLIHARFGTSFGQIERIDPARSDRHRGGRTVAFLLADDGTRLVYKPRDIELEPRFAELLRWIARRSGGELALSAPPSLSRPGYGWVGFVSREPCGSMADVERYYQRAGALLCLLYVLDASDCHYENLVAHGDLPVLVDLETLMHPGKDRRRYGESANVRAVALEQMARSVLSTGLLPTWSTDLHGGFYDGSGLGGVAPQQTANRYPFWTNLNSDDSELRYHAGSVVPRSNVVRLGTAPVDPNDHVEACVAGFTTMYRWLMARREQVLADGSPIHALSGQRCRYVHRMTREYSARLRRVVERPCLTSGVELSLVLDGLSARDAVDTRQPPPTWPLIVAEQRALARLDIPYFSALSDARTLEVEDGAALEGFFLHSGFEGVGARLAALSNADLRAQVQYMRASFAARRASGLHAAEEPAHSGPQETVGDQRALDDEAIVTAAREIADQLVESAITAEQGLTWVGLETLDMGERFQLQPLGPTLYSGTVGVALLFAALARTLDDQAYRDVALRCLAPVREAARRADFMHRGPIGGCTGIGSVAYGLVTAGRLLADEALLEDALCCARRIDAGLIRSDQTGDVVHGAAGAILALTAVHAASGAPDVLERAVACAEHLLSRRSAAPDGRLGWTSPDGRMLTGFSHGAAGIACALARLARATSDPRFARACHAALDFERALRCEAGWLGSPGKRTTFVAWCHGAPGIGLARLSIEQDLACDLDADLRRAVERTLAQGVGGLDHLCCGSSGRIELLLSAGEARANADWRRRSRLWVDQMIERSRRQGGFRTMKDAPASLSHPGFFQGLAGVGYTLLRVVAPGLPCVLLWQ